MRVYLGADHQGYYLKNKIRDYLTMTLGLILISTEIYKQILFAYHYNFEGEYHWSLFPFQLCSIPMYTSAIMPLAKNEKLRKSLFAFMAFIEVFFIYLSWFC